MLPKINQHLYFQIESIDEEEAKQEYKSRIADIKEKYFAIEIPLNKKTGKFKRLYEDDHLNAYLISEEGVKHYFHTKVVGFREDTIRQVIIRRPDPEMITKVQRRNYLRVPAQLEVAIQTDHLQFIGETEDLSGGGLSFICEGKYPLTEKEEIACWLLLNFKNTVDHVFFKGQVVRVKKLETGRQLGMLSFTDIQEGERQKVIRFCFERQFDLRKK